MKTTCQNLIINHFTSRLKCMSGSRDPGVTIVNPTEISVMYGYVIYGSKGVEKYKNQ